MISLNNISVLFSGEYLFRDITFMINKKDRIGLVGKNGAGKTTILKILASEFEPSKGNLAVPNDFKTGYLPQEKISTTNTTPVFDEAMSAFSEAIELEKLIAKYTHEISERTDYHSDEYLKIIENLNHVNERYQLIGASTREAETEKILLGLGFLTSEFNKPMNALSGGWQMRVELAKILLQQPDLILLDEPTNHLDIESIQWLEEFLTGYFGAVVVVSHDRTFLDNVTNRTIEIQWGKIYDFKCSYSEYVFLREEQRQNQMAALTNQQREIADIESFVNRFRYKASKAKQVQSRIKQLEKIDRIEIDEKDMTSIHFKFPPAPRSGKVVVEAENLTKQYGNNLVLKDLSFGIQLNEKIAFVGKNGEGKTTLSRIIIGQLEHDGKMQLGHNVKIGYYAQNQHELLNGEKTVFQTLDDIAVGDIRTRIRAILGGFLFIGDDIDKKVKVLSGGEKARLALAAMLLSPVNLLVLDEPTNHLDMISKDILKNALLNYDGTMIIVSHDRDFLQGLTNKVFEFKNKTIREYKGDVFDFIESRRLSSLSDLEKNKSVAKETEKTTSNNKEQYEIRKQQERDKRKISNQIAKIETEIEQFENKIQMLEDLLANPDKQGNLSYDKLFAEYQRLKGELAKSMEAWEEQHQILETFGE